MIPSGDIWLGLDDSKIDNVFVAVDESPFDKSHWTNWMSNKPNFVGSGAAYICSKFDCGSIEWDDKSINEHSNALCVSFIPGQSQFSKLWLFNRIAYFLIRY